MYMGVCPPITAKAGISLFLDVDVEEERGVDWPLVGFGTSWVFTVRLQGASTAGIPRGNISTLVEWLWTEIAMAENYLAVDFDKFTILCPSEEFWGCVNSLRSGHGSR